MGAITETLRKTCPRAMWFGAGRDDAAIGIVGEEYVFVCETHDGCVAEDSNGVESFAATPDGAVYALSIWSDVARRCYGCENVAMAISDPGVPVPAKPLSFRPD